MLHVSNNQADFIQLEKNPATRVFQNSEERFQLHVKFELVGQPLSRCRVAAYSKQ